MDKYLPEQTFGVPPGGRMSVEQFDAELARLQGLYGDSRKEAGARYEQALAKHFYVSGWTQQELAKRTGKTKGRVTQLLNFGRFLGFCEKFTAVNFPDFPPLGLTERRFRAFWEQTDSINHNIRFRDVLRLMQEDALAPQTRRSRDLGKAVVAGFADGKWRDPDAIAKHVEASPEDVQSVLQNMVDKGTFRCSAEKREFAKSHQYRIFPQERQVSTVELVEKLSEPLARLKEQGAANMATMSPPTVAFWTAQIQALINEWSGRPSKGKMKKKG